MRLLVAEDDPLLADGLSRGLKPQGYQVEHCDSGRQVLQALQQSHFDALVLDLGLRDGFALPVLKMLRQQGQQLPVLVLTALDDVDTKVAALNSGADDYLSKPFDLRELEARLRVLARRRQTMHSDEIQLADLRLDIQNRTCWRAATPLALTQKEFVLLYDFMQHPDKIRSRSHLEELCYGWDGDVESNALEVHIHNLRKKCGAERIRTIRGAGYMLVSQFS